MMKTLRTLSLLALLPVLVSCGGGGDSGCATGLGVLGGAICGGSSPNTAPVANAGVTQNVRVASLVTLDGSGSRDENNDTLTYLWEMTAKPTGSVAALTSTTSASAARRHRRGEADFADHRPAVCVVMPVEVRRLHAEFLHPRQLRRHLPLHRRAVDSAPQARQQRRRQVLEVFSRDAADAQGLFLAR